MAIPVSDVTMLPTYDIPDDANVSSDKMFPNPSNSGKQSEVKNPANLRWQYIIESLIEKENMTGNVNLRNQLKECIESLQKFPLVLEQATHCAILCGFNANIIDLMKKASLETDELKMNPPKNLENWNLSPISRRQGSGMLDVRDYIIFHYNYYYSNFYL